MLGFPPKKGEGSSDGVYPSQTRQILLNERARLSPRKQTRLETEKTNESDDLQNLIGFPIEFTKDNQFIACEIPD